GRYAHVSHFRHSRVAFRSDILQYKDTVLITVEIRIVDAGLVVFDVFEDHRLATMDHQRLRCSGGLDDGTVFREIAPEDGNARQFAEGLIDGRDHFAIIAYFFFSVRAKGVSIDSDTVVGKKRLQFLEYDRKASGIVEIFHEIFS